MYTETAFVRMQESDSRGSFLTCFIRKMKMEQYEYPNRITLCEDGQYRWSYVLSKEQSRFNYRMMIEICSIIGVLIAGIMAFMFGSMLSHDPSLWWSIAAVLTGMIGLPALLGYFLMNGGEVYQYEMDQEYIRHKHATKGGDAWIRFKKIRDMTVNGDVFMIKIGITTYRVYVPNEDKSFLKQYIEERY